MADKQTSLTGDLLIEACDIKGYDRIRHMALARLASTSNPAAAEHLIKTSLLLPADESIMKLMPALARVTAESIQFFDPKINGESYIPAWRAFALALLEYRRGHFPETMGWLGKCSRFPDQSPSCVASVHLLRSMAYFQLGQIAQADSELKQGREMVESHFRQKLELGDNKTGKLQGWIMTLIFQREADKLSETASGHRLTGSK